MNDSGSVEPRRLEPELDECCESCLEPWRFCVCDEYGDDGGDCFWCGGEGWVECDDPIQCTREHSADGCCRCSSCGGSGNAKDMTIW